MIRLYWTIVSCKDLSVKKWLWEEEQYPDFPYKAEQKIAIETFIEEIMASSAIEGEYLNYDSVRSLVRKRLDQNFNLGEGSSTQTESMISHSG
jgi:Fic family protein